VAKAAGQLGLQLAVVAGDELEAAVLDCHAGRDEPVGRVLFERVLELVAPAEPRTG
jgi:hypothetical protein